MYLGCPGHSSFGEEDLLKNVNDHSKRFQVYHMAPKFCQGKRFSNAPNLRILCKSEPDIVNMY